MGVPRVALLVWRCGGHGSAPMFVPRPFDCPLLRNSWRLAAHLTRAKGGKDTNGVLNIQCEDFDRQRVLGGDDPTDTFAVFRVCDAIFRCTANKMESFASSVH